jgi:hypothetical protein
LEWLLVGSVVLLAVLYFASNQYFWYGVAIVATLWVAYLLFQPKMVEAEKPIPYGVFRVPLDLGAFLQDPHRYRGSWRTSIMNMDRGFRQKAEGERLKVTGYEKFRAKVEPEDYWLGNSLSIEEGIQYLVKECSKGEIVYSHLDFDRRMCEIVKKPPRLLDRNELLASAMVSENSDVLSAMEGKTGRR